MNRNSQVQLDVTQLQTEQLCYQVLVITLLQPEDLFIPDKPEGKNLFFNHIKPSELETLALPAQLNFDQGTVLYGNAPAWLYAYLVDLCHQAPWIACYAAPLGKAVVVKSLVAYPQVGDVVSIPTRDTPGMTIAIGGPPDSGKSILSNALRSTLLRYAPNLKVFLHRANWDGEGNWSYETSDRQIVQTLVQRGEYPIHRLPNAEALMQSYFDYHAKATKNIRNIVDLAIVDLGGKPQEQKMPVVEQCTHYLIISSQPDEIPQWHELFSKHLKPLAVLHSKASPDLQLPARSSHLEQIVDLAELIQTQQISEELLGAIVQALPRT